MKEIFSQIISPAAILDNPSDLEFYGRDWCKDFKANPGLILAPENVDELQKIVSLCSQHSLAIVPSGGRTGLSGGATATQGEIVLSLARMNRILDVNRSDRTLTAEAGAITERVQSAAAEHNLLFPIDFASVGSSSIGGNVATNAGGIRVLRYGNTRDWVVGLKVVLADGSVLDLDKRLYKNQTGYDLRALFIGSEGTLGIIAEVTVELTRRPQHVTRALLAFDTISQVLESFSLLRAKFANLSAFEYFAGNALGYVQRHHTIKDPFEKPSLHYALVEIEDVPDGEEIEEFLFDLHERELTSEVVLAQNNAQAEALLKIRELIPETLSSKYVPHKNDISVPISAIPKFIAAANQIIADANDEFDVVIFGHIGDGNLHLNTIKPAEMENSLFFERCVQTDLQIFALIKELNGSISAEHGVGLLKKPYLSYSRDQVQIDLMRSIKKLLDPKGILNPGKIFD